MGRTLPHSIKHIVEYDILSYVFSMIIIILTIIHQQNVIIPFVNMELISEQYDPLTFFPHIQEIIYHF